MKLPGEVIQEKLLERGWTQADLSCIIMRPQSAINTIIKGKRKIKVVIARELAAAFSTTALYWMELQNAYDLAQPSRRRYEVVS